MRTESFALSILSGVLIGGLCYAAEIDAARITFPSPIGGMEALAKQIVYPPEAKKDCLTGKVLIEVKIGETGAILETKVKEGVRKDLDQAAIDAVRGVKWSLPLIDGKPQSLTILIPIDFRLEEKPGGK